MVRDVRLPSTVHLPDWQWEYIEEGQDDRSVSNHNKQSLFTKTAVQTLQELILFCLTQRQQEVISQYYLNDKTQQEIAEDLGISQPTVSQHLHGKMRNGHKIGGAHRRIMKNASKLTKLRLLPPEKAQVIEVLLSFG